MYNNKNIECDVVNSKYVENKTFEKHFNMPIKYIFASRKTLEKILFNDAISFTIIFSFRYSRLFHVANTFHG